MRPLLATIAVVVVACAKPPPRQPPLSPDEEPPLTAAEANAQLGVATGESSTPDKALAEQSARERAARDQSAVEAQIREAQRLADPNVQRAAAEAPVKKKCEETRAARVVHAKERIIARMTAEARLYENAKAIRAACRLTERKTGAVTVSRAASGLRVAPELADDVQCSRLPNGITKNDAYVVLFRDREGSRGPTGPILDADDASPEDGMCMLHDADVGLNLHVSFDDPSSVERLRTWAPPPK